jgi:hypothetical protein
VQTREGTQVDKSHGAMLGNPPPDDDD